MQINEWLYCNIIIILIFIFQTKEIYLITSSYYNLNYYKTNKYKGVLSKIWIFLLICNIFYWIDMFYYLKLFDLTYFFLFEIFLLKSCFFSKIFLFFLLKQCKINTKKNKNNTILYAGAWFYYKSESYLFNFLYIKYILISSPFNVFALLFISFSPRTHLHM